MNNRSQPKEKSSYSAAIVIISFLGCLWGLFAYLHMKKELLPASRERLVIALVTAPGMSSQEVKDRLSEPAKLAFLNSGIPGELVASYHAHYALFQVQTILPSNAATILNLLRRALETICKTGNIAGSTVTLKNEPMANRTSLVLGIPSTVHKEKESALITKLQNTNGVSYVKVDNEPRAWTESKDWKIIEVVRRENTNPVELSESIVPNLEKDVKIFSNEADYIRASESNLYENVFSGTLLTIACVYIFIRKFYSTLVIGASIPICLLLTLPVLYLLGVSNNVMSMAGMALSVGIVVDSTLSVVSDFNELIATGRYSRTQAAAATVKASFTPLLLASLSTSAVFVPVLFLQGKVGTLFSDLSIAVIISNCVSLVVSLLIIPSILSYSGSLAKTHSKNKCPNQVTLWMLAKVSLVQTTCASLWSRIFSACTAKPLSSLALIVASGCAVFAAIQVTPQPEFLPPPRSGPGFIQIKEPEKSIENWDTPALKGYSATLISLIKMVGGIDPVLQFQNGRLNATFTWPNPNFAIAKELLRKEFPGYESFVSIQNPLKALSLQTEDVSFYLKGSQSSKGSFRAWLSENRDVESFHFAEFERSQVVSNDREVSREVSFAQPFETLRRFAEGALHIEGAYAVLSQPHESMQINGEAVSRVSAKLASTESTLSFLQKAKTTSHNFGLVLQESAESKEAEQSLMGLAWCLLVAVVIIFATLYIQNRSTAKSAIILGTFIWAPLGAIPGLILHNETLNGSALVGFILLAGTIVNNGILLMDRIEKNIQLQMAPFEAAKCAVEERFLNVVVTGLTTVLAMAPMIGGGQEGSQMYRSLSIVVVYGTLASTPISFLGIPALMTLRNWSLSFVSRLNTRRKVNALRGRLLT